MTALLRPKDDVDPSERISAGVLEAAGRIAPLRFAALIAKGDGPLPQIVHAIGAGAEDCAGRMIDDSEGTSLPAMALKNGTLMPTERTWHPAHGDLLGFEGGPTMAEGEPVLSLPLSIGAERVGALVLVGEQPFDQTTTDTLKGFAELAAGAVLHGRDIVGWEARATTDALTGLNNRATVLQQLERSFARCGRSKQSLAALTLDIDHFKTVNDRYGHPAGDMVLRQVSRTLEESKRLNDCVGRFGGEEFLIVLEDTDEAGALLVAERIRTRIAALTFPSQAGSFRVTASLGVAVSPRHADRTDDLLRKSDRALYLAKEGGRNQVVLHGQRRDSGHLEAVNA